MMAKDKSLKSKSKKNKLTSNDIQDVAEEQVETKRKRKHVEAEVSNTVYKGLSLGSHNFP